MRGPRWTPAWALAAATTTCWTSHGLALDKHACVVASDQGQALRLEGKLALARAQFVACGDPSCPSLVRSACADWLNDLDKMIPSVLLSVRDREGHDVVDATVLLDGAPLSDALSGRSVLIDPGPHTLRFTAPRTSPVEQAVVIREGEQHRRIDVVLEPAAASVSPPLPPPPAKASSGAPVAAWAFTVGAGVAWSVFAGFAIDGHVAYENEKSACGPHCTGDPYASINTRFDVADVSLGVAVALTGVATVLFLTHRSSPPPPTATGSAPLTLRF